MLKNVVGHVVAVHVGAPRTISWRGGEVTTGIFKKAVAGRVRAAGTNLRGDGQADLVNHGGVTKAVYAYPREHYAFWRAQLGSLPDGAGVFGENLTVEGVDENQLHIGDLLQIGTALLRVTEPRFPCFKLGIRLGDASIVDRFVHANRPGFYMTIEKAGDLAAGDAIRLAESDPGRLSVADLMRLRTHSGPKDQMAIQNALRVPSLTPLWREQLEDRLANLASAPRWPGVRSFVVTSSRAEGADVVLVTLRPKDQGPLGDHQLGQFVTIELPGKPPLRRCYSLIDDSRAGTLQIAVKRAAQPRHGAGSWRVHELREGDEVGVLTPAGAFTPSASGTRPLVLIAGGIGVTPIHAIAAAVTAGELNRETHVYYAARRHGADPLADSLRSMADRGAISLRIVYSQAAPYPHDRYAMGPRRLSVDDVLETADVDDIDVMLCGPGEMVKDFSETLAALGVPGDRIAVEEFEAATSLTLMATDIEIPTDGFPIRFAKSGAYARWTDPGQTLLDMAEKLGLDHPWSCRAGSCGTCVARLIDGEVLHVRQPAVRLDPGYCLPCSAVPKTAVELDI